MAPIGIRNNNPGNLRPSNAYTWNGEVGENGGFIVFSDMAHGIRAWIIDLHTDIVLHGQNTIRKRISSYAPSSDHNNTEKYISDVAAAMGIGADEVFPTDYDSIKTMFFTQMHEEVAPYDKDISEEDFQAGFDLVPATKRAFFLSEKKSATT